MPKRVKCTGQRCFLGRALIPTVTLGIALTACSTGDGVRTAIPSADNSPPASATGAPATPAPSAAANQQVVAERYIQFQLVAAQAAATSDPRDPRLPALATGAVLENLRGKLAVRRRSGTHLYGVPVPHVQSVAVTGDRAVLRDCLDNSHTGLMDRSGKKLSVGRARQQTTATLVRQGGMWKVSEITTVAGGGSC